MGRRAIGCRTRPAKYPAGVIGAALWPRGRPHRTVVFPTGDIGVAAATTPDADVVGDLFGTLSRVRQAQFESEVGIEEPDAWDTGAGEPGVVIDIHRALTAAESESAWGRWRKQWQDKVPLNPGQQSDKQHPSVCKFNKKMRTNFTAFVKNWMGEPHVARFLIKHGVEAPGNIVSTTGLIEAVRAAKERGAGEPPRGVETLRREAYLARRALRDGARFARKEYGKLGERGQRLHEGFVNRTLHRRVDKANQAYGHGMARTHDFGFKPGQNMCKQIPQHVAIALAVLKPYCIANC